jgi:hypothetical protein
MQCRVSVATVMASRLRRLALGLGARLAAVPSYALEGCNKHMVLAAWLSAAEEHQPGQ